MKDNLDPKELDPKELDPKELRTLRRALLEAAKADYLETLKTAPEAPPASRSHRRWERRFLHDPFSLLRPHSSPWQRPLRTAACFLLTASVVFATVLAASPTARAEMLQWVVTEHQDHIAYKFQGQTDSATLGEWGILALPEGYQQSERTQIGPMVFVLYDNGDTEMEIELDYQLLEEGGEFNLDNEWHTVSEIRVAGKPGQLFTSTEAGCPNMIVWIDRSTEHAFLLTSSLPCDTLLKLAESVAPVEK